MSGLGTIINAAAITAGGAAGMLAGTAVKERYQETLNMACGVSILFLGIGGAMEKMLSIFSIAPPIPRNRILTPQAILSVS